MQQRLPGDAPAQQRHKDEYKLHRLSRLNPSQGITTRLSICIGRHLHLVTQAQTCLQTQTESLLSRPSQGRDAGTCSTICNRRLHKRGERAERLTPTEGQASGDLRGGITQGGSDTGAVVKKSHPACSSKKKNRFIEEAPQGAFFRPQDLQSRLERLPSPA